MINNDQLSQKNVYYGWAKINRIRKRIAISVIFENGDHYGEIERRMRTVKRLQDTCYIRKQTVSEAEDGKHCNRVLTEYSMFLHSKQIEGDLEKLLEANYQADINNVSENVLVEIKESLRKSFTHINRSIRYET